MSKFQSIRLTNNDLCDLVFILRKLRKKTLKKVIPRSCVARKKDQDRDRNFGDRANALLKSSDLYHSTIEWSP